MARPTKLASLLSKGFDEEATRYDETEDPGREPLYPDGVPDKGLGMESAHPAPYSHPPRPSFEEKLPPDAIPDGTTPGRPLSMLGKRGKKRGRSLDAIEYPAEASHNPNGYTTQANLTRESNGSGKRPKTRRRAKGD